MNWLLVVFATTFTEKPVTVFQAPMATEELCRAAEIEVKASLSKTDQGGIVVVSTACLQVAS